jgi:hypothetical protein
VDTGAGAGINAGWPRWAAGWPAALPWFALPLAALPFSPGSDVPADVFAAAADEAPVESSAEVVPSEPSPGTLAGACTRLSTPSSSAPFTDPRLSPVRRF